MRTADLRVPIAILLTGVVLPGCNDRSSQPQPVEAPAPAAGELPAAREPSQEFVGSTTCAECHLEQHESYLRTAHSRSLSLVDPDREPLDAGFLHELSGRSYAVYRQDGQLRHREALLTEDSGTIAASDFPVKYLVGSGSHTRSYLSEIDGFLVESPITWYESRQEWDVSPGYDVPHSAGFQRAADMGCLACHVGSAEEIDGSLHRIRFHELAIGCERCHGPGREHVDAAQLDRPHDDLTAAITNPARLSRTLTEDICAQCHLRGDATVFLPGKGPLDFRPGAALMSVRVDFAMDSPNSQMKVVGHVEQMRLSRCYTQSGELTCTTCHQMHAEASESSMVGFYRSRCLDCHTADGCHLPQADERRVAKLDNCLTCHMPKSETDIPHIAFTHHRIGIHSEATTVAAAGDEPPRLIPHQDVSGLDPILVQHIVGLAYLELAARQPSEQLFAHCYSEATLLLEQANRQRPGDGDVSAALAQLSLHTYSERAARFADVTLELDSLRAESHVNALMVRALTAFNSGDLDRAVSALEELQTMRRFAEDSVLLGNVLRASDPNRAVAELHSAAEIQPFRADVASQLANLLRQLGRSEEAREHQQRAEMIQQHRLETDRRSGNQ